MSPLHSGTEPTGLREVARPDDELREVRGIHDRCTGDMDSWFATLSLSGMTACKQKSPAEIPRGFVFNFVKKNFHEEDFLCA
jgi:hypothetical protein